VDDKLTNSITLSAYSVSLGSLLLDLAVLTNHAGRCSRYGGCHCGDEIGGSSRSDPIFRPLDEDAQNGESLVFWALRVVGTLLNAP